MAAIAVLLFVLLVIAFLVPALATTDPDHQNLLKRLIAPTWHSGTDVLGTDQLGRAMWIRLAEGLRTSYIVACLAVALGFAIGVTAGLTAGYMGGRTDDVIMRVAEIQMSLPGLLIAIAILAVLGGGVVPLIIILGLDNWMLYARTSRSLVRTMRDSDFVLATRSLGATAPRTVFRHLLPNATPALVAIATIELSRVMLAEAALSFLGFGVQPPTVSLGLILAQGRDYLAVQWWITTLAGALLAVAVLCVSLFGNWLQRVTDPVGLRSA
jgi:peptide/nickel transport system permease protein